MPRRKHDVLHMFQAASLVKSLVSPYRNGFTTHGQRKNQGLGELLLAKPSRSTPATFLRRTSTIKPCSHRIVLRIDFEKTLNNARSRNWSLAKASAVNRGSLKAEAQHDGAVAVSLFWGPRIEEKRNVLATRRALGFAFRLSVFL